MTRSKNDRRVVAIMADVDHILASPRLKSDGLLDAALGKIITFGACADWLCGDHWSPDALHSITLAMALHAPPKAFRQLVGVVNEARKFVEYWDERGWIDAEYAEGPERDAMLVANGVKPKKAA